MAQATSHGPSPRAARQNLVQVVVRPGQTLWSVAESADPDQDTRVVVQQIVDLNSLSGPTVPAGQRCGFPAAEREHQDADTPASGARDTPARRETRRAEQRGGPVLRIIRSRQLASSRLVVYRNHNI